MMRLMENSAGLKTKVLDILERRFDLITTGSPSGYLPVAVTGEDMDQADLRMSDLRMTIHFLTTNYPELKTPKVYDDINEDPPDEPLLSQVLQTFARIEVPTNFKEILKTIRADIANGTLPSIRGAKKYWIEIKDRQLVLNGSWVLAKPDFNSTNEIVFERVYRGPGEKLRRQDIKIVPPLNKDFDDIVRDLNFRDGLQKLFFPGISKSAIIFRNPVYESDLSLSPAEQRKLNKYIKSLKRLGKGIR